MSYEKEIGAVLGELLEELIVCDDTGLQLNEIRDTSRLEAEMKRLGRRHPHYERLKGLHARKVAIEERRAAKRERMYEIARQHEYRDAGKHPKGSRHFVHKKTGHTLTIHDNHTWHHRKSGSKRGQRSLTPIRHLKQYLKKLHQEDSK